jgi:hypothetical protein
VPSNFFKVEKTIVRECTDDSGWLKLSSVCRGMDDSAL